MLNTNYHMIMKNTLLLYVRMFLTLLIGLYTSRVLLSVLGAVDFGLYNVVGGIIILTNVLTVSVSSAGIRFITYYLGKENTLDLKELFGNLLTIYIVLAVIVFILGETIGLWLVMDKLSIPSERFNACIWVYQISIFAAIVNILSLPYNSVIIAHEKMSAFAYITIFDVILKLLIVYITLLIPYDKLIIYAILVLIIQLFDRVLYGVYCSCKFDEVHVCPMKNNNLIKKIISYSFWATIGGVGYMGYTQGLNILLNIFFGPAVNAARAISVQVETKSRSFSESFQLAVKPQIIKNYASENLERVRQLIVLSSKFSFYLILLIAIPVSFGANEILTWWLVEVPKWTREFVIITFAITAIRVLADPLFQVIHAEGHIRNFQIVEGSTLILILPICYLLIKYHNVSPIIPYFVLLILELIAQCIRLAFALPIVKYPLRDYVREIMLPTISVLFLSLGFLLVVVKMIPLIYSNILLGMIISFVITFITIACIGCNKKERDIIIDKLHSFIRKVR